MHLSTSVVWGNIGGMSGIRVFQIANEFKVDTIKVAAVLESIGESGLQPESRLEDDIAEAVRAVLRVKLRRAEQEDVAARENEERRKRRAEREARAAQAREAIARRETLDDYVARVQSAIPAIGRELKLLLSKVEQDWLPPVIVVRYCAGEDKPYWYCDLDGEPWVPLGGEARRHSPEVLGALRVVNEEFRRLTGVLPVDSYWLAFSHGTGTAWHADSLSKLRRMRRSRTQHLDAETLEPVLGSTAYTGPPRLAEHARPVSPEKALALMDLVGGGSDRPEEAFLIDEGLLRLAVDSLDGASAFAPLPVHVNAIWVFARPVAMRRPDGSARHVGMLWFREGAVMWRLNAYTAGGGKAAPTAKQLGNPLSGRLPFVPVWDESRAEQKLIAAIWALMAQGDVTENEPVERAWPGLGRPVRDGSDGGRGLTVVRVKAGTHHASAYGTGTGDGRSMQGTWSVRGHWRQQPYPSLGLDEEGRVITKPVWIASYTKGEAEEGTTGRKVIVVRS